MHQLASGGQSELTLCRNTIKRIAKTLELLERKHGMTTAQFIAEQEDGALPADPDFQEDWAAWRTSVDSLREWERLEKQYSSIRLNFRKEP